MQEDLKRCYWLAKNCPYKVQGRTDEVMVGKKKKKSLLIISMLSAQRPCYHIQRKYADMIYQFLGA